MNSVRVTPTRSRLVLGWCISLACLAIAVWSVPSSWPDLSTLERSLVLVTVSFLVPGVIDYSQRIYEFSEGQVRWRILFCWRQKHLPANVWVVESDKSEVFLTAAGSNEVLFRVPNDYNHRSSLASALKGVYKRGRP